MWKNSIFLLLFIEEFAIISSMKTEENPSLLLAEKDALIDALKEQNKDLQELVAQLQLQIKQLQKKIFGKSSERFVDDPQPFLPGLEP